MRILIFLSFIYTIHALTDPKTQFSPARYRKKSERSTSQEGSAKKPDPYLPYFRNYTNFEENKPTEVYTISGYPNENLAPQSFGWSTQNLYGKINPNLNQGRVSHLRRSEATDIYQRPLQEVTAPSDFSTSLTTQLQSGILETLAQNIQNYFNKKENPDAYSSMPPNSAPNNLAQISSQLSQMQETPSNFFNSMSSLFGVSSSSPDGYASNMFGAQNGNVGQNMRPIQGQGQENGYENMMGNGDYTNGMQQSSYPTNYNSNGYPGNAPQSPEIPSNGYSENSPQPNTNGYPGNAPQTQEMQSYGPNSMPDISMSNGSPNTEMQQQNYGYPMSQNLPPQPPEQSLSMSYSNYPGPTPQDQESANQPTLKMTYSQQNLAPNPQETSYSSRPNSWTSNPQPVGTNFGSNNIVDASNGYRIIDGGCLACQLKRACQPRACCCQCQQVCQQKCFSCQQPQQIFTPSNDNFWNNYAMTQQQTNFNPNSNPTNTVTNNMPQEQNSWDTFSNSFRSIPISNAGVPKTFQFINPFNNQKLNCDYSTIFGKKIKKVKKSIV